MNVNSLNIRAFFFDLDGTLLNTEVLYVEAVKQALADRRCALNHDEAVKLVYGKGWTDVYAESQRRFPDSYPTVQEMQQAVNKHFTTLRDRNDVRVHSSIDLLITLSNRFPVAIVSGSPRREVEEGINLMGIGDRLAFFLGAEDYTPGKPNPACYRLAAKRVGIDPHHCLVFEDSTAGVHAAKQARMYCVALQRPGAPTQDFSNADWVVSDLAVFDLFNTTETI